MVGAATDPYQPAEGRYRLTRGCLEALAAARNPFSIITRGPMIVRDVDVLAEASRRADVHVTFSVPTLDDAIWRTTEPGTAPPRQRLRALRTLVDAGIDAGVGMAPILPGLSDRPELLARRREGRPRRRRDRDLDERPVPPAGDPRALPREPRPRLAGAAAALPAAVRRPGVPRQEGDRARPSGGGRPPPPVRGRRPADGPAAAVAPGRPARAAAAGRRRVSGGERARTSGSPRPRRLESFANGECHSAPAAIICGAWWASWPSSEGSRRTRCPTPRPVTRWPSPGSSRRTTTTWRVSAL